MLTYDENSRQTGIEGISLILVKVMYQILELMLSNGETNSQWSQENKKYSPLLLFFKIIVVDLISVSRKKKKRKRKQKYEDWKERDKIVIRSNSYDYNIKKN